MPALNDSVEDPIEPNRPIIDPHHHCWGDTPPVPQFPPYGRGDLIDDIDTAGHNIVASVYVEANSHYRSDGPASLRPVGETEYIEALAVDSASRGGRYAGLFAGIISHADLLLGDDVLDVLEAHRAASPTRLKGIRHRTAYDSDNALHSAQGPGLHSDPRFHRGFRHLAQLGLSFDVCVLHPQLSEIADLANSFPATSFVINHIGQPMMIGRFSGRRRDVFEEWSISMTRLASLPNVTVKIGGMNMGFTGLSFIGDVPGSIRVAERQRDFIVRTIDLFGPDRCMFQSNFPVDKVGITYDVLWNAFKIVASEYSESEKDDLFFNTANRVYSLGL